ncbi:hypothetical protein E6W36_02715 [Hankyongella ginsenosidimutans]|uniref:Uncharacterized protein n=1 Tax=Hankyongella ginsenosidimutans TaxID=1763828 RepID=A0A4D7C739_9SPHN|nr:hypothetical protein [Hankyongella ginsenosidimutans]QCI78908.1 hypothetical protein E6W36_02715 [Hankyongella ginsenosidimutans]
MRLTLVRLPQATPQPAPGVSPPAAPLLRIALDTLPEAAKAALAIPTELAGTALLAPTQGALRAGLIPPGAPTLPNPGAPTLPTPGAPTLAAALPPASQPRPSPVLQALRPAAPPLPGGPATSVPPLPEAGSRIVHAPVPEYPRQPAPHSSEHRAAQASQPAAVPPPQAEVAPKTVPPSAPLAPNPPRQNPAPAATGLLPAPGPAPAAYAVASPVSAVIAPASAFSPDPWLKAPTLILSTAEGRPVGHVSVVAAEPAAAHSLLRAPTPDSPLGRLVKAGRLLIAETRAEGASQDAARLHAPAHAATQPARPEAAPVATLRIVAGGQEYVLVSPRTCRPMHRRRACCCCTPARRTRRHRHRRRKPSYPKPGRGCPYPGRRDGCVPVQGAEPPGLPDRGAGAGQPRAGPVAACTSSGRGRSRSRGAAPADRPAAAHPAGPADPGCLVVPAAFATRRQSG